MTYNIAAIALIHILISLIYFAFILYRDNLQQSVFRLIVVLLLPGAGIIFFMLSGLFSRVLKETENIEKSYQDYIKDRDHIHYVEDIDLQNELNTLPLVDLLTMGTQQQRRLSLVQLLKKDYSRYIKVLQKAVSNEDSETSHYAGAALVEIKKQFEKLLHSANEEYKNNSSDLSAIRNNIDTIKKYLLSGLPDKIEGKEFADNLSYLLEKYLEKDQARKQYFIDKIKLDLDLENYDLAKEYCKKFCYRFPDEQEAYFMLLKFFYTTSNLKSLKKVSDYIKDKQFNLSEKNRKMIDYWERFVEGAV